MRERTGETSEWRTTGLTLGEFAREGEILLELFCVRRNRVLCGFDCIGAFLSFFPLVITTNLA